MYKVHIGLFLGPSVSPAHAVPPERGQYISLSTGQSVYRRIEPYGYWSVQFQQKDPSYMEFNFTISRGAQIAIYGRSDSLPSHTSYDFIHIIKGYSTVAREAKTSAVSTITPYQTMVIQKSDLIYSYQRVPSYPIITLKGTKLFQVNSFTKYTLSIQYILKRNKDLEMLYFL